MFHRLRVVSFSRTYLSDGTNTSKPKEKEIQISNASNTEIANEVEEPVCSKEIRKKPCVTYEEDAQEGIKCETTPTPMFLKNLTLIKKSFSETLPIHPSKQCRYVLVVGRKK